MSEAIPLPVLLRRACRQLLGSGCPPQELIAALIGAGVDLSNAISGPKGTRDLFTDIAIKLDEDLNFAEDSGNV